VKTLILLSSLIFSITTFAGPGKKGHSHKPHAISQEKTIEVGKSQIKRLIKSGKINASWNNSTHERSEKKKFNSRAEWVVTFTNEKGVKGKRLYIFLKLSGKFIAANFTGK